MSERVDTPLEQVLDLLVYAPLGLAITARDNLPDLVSKGRERVANQVVLARLVGQFAVRQGQTEAGKRVDQARRTVEERLSAFGSGPPSPAAGSGPTATTSPSGVPGSPPTESATATAPGSAANRQAPDEAVAGPPPGPASASSRPTSSLLAIPGYDALSASQVVQRLAGLSADELEAVRIYESVTRGRKTILSKIAQQQSN